MCICPFCPGKPTCRCPVGFSGPFCEKRICDSYCLNGGTCDITEGNQPVCRCMAEYTGDRCLYREFCTITLHRETLSWVSENICHKYIQCLHVIPKNINLSYVLAA